MNKKLFTKKDLKKGFSLVETILTITIMTLIFGLIGLFQTNIFSLNNLIHTNLNNQYEVKKLLKSFTFELRNAVSPAPEIYPLVQAGTSTLIFYANLDNQEDIEKIFYILEGNDLKKYAIKPTGENVYDEENMFLVTKIENVENDTVFYYYNLSSDGALQKNSLSQPVNVEEVRLIKMKFQSGSNFEIQIAPRNL